MAFSTTYLPGLLLYMPVVHKDERGYFLETFRSDLFDTEGVTRPFVQDNESWSKKGTLRGLHFQTGESAQAKLVRVVKGSVLDVVADIRPGSPTFGQHYKIVLSCENYLQMYIPRGFAHGYLVLSDEAVFTYKCDNYYDRSSESGIRCDDPGLAIEWGMEMEEMKISEKDLNLPYLRNLSDLL